MMACLAAHRRDLPDRVFIGFLPMIRREAHDGRNFVRKAANWALRAIGKRRPAKRGAGLPVRPLDRVGRPARARKMTPRSKSVRHMGAGRFARIHGIL
jgi:hypothetical protein